MQLGETAGGGKHLSNSWPQTRPMFMSTESPIIVSPPHTGVSKVFPDPGNMAVLPALGETSSGTWHRMCSCTAAPVGTFLCVPRDGSCVLASAYPSHHQVHPRSSRKDCRRSSAKRSHGKQCNLLNTLQLPHPKAVQGPSVNLEEPGH